MSIDTLTELLPALIGTYGSAALALVVFAAALGVPLPSTLCVIAGGACVAQGVLSPGNALLLGLAGVVAGDTLGYTLGRLLREPIWRRHGQRAAWRRAEATFARRGGLAIVLTRCVLTPLAVPVNLIAGGSSYPARRFVGYAAAGEVLWLLGYGGLGYLFSNQWEALGEQLGSGSGLLAAVALAGLAAYVLAHSRTPRRAATARR